MEARRNPPTERASPRSLIFLMVNLKPSVSNLPKHVSNIADTAEDTLFVRELRANESLAVDIFERHVSICLSCGSACPDFNAKYHEVCEQGHALAVNLIQYLFIQNENCFSQADVQSEARRPERVSLPRRFTASYCLLRAVERGLILSFDKHEITRNPYSTGMPWYPGGQYRKSHFSGNFGYPGRPDGSKTRDSGYDSRATSVYSHDRSTHGSLNLPSQSKDKGKMVPSSSQEGKSSRPRSTHRQGVHVFNSLKNEAEEMDPLSESPSSDDELDRSMMPAPLPPRPAVPLPPRQAMPLPTRPGIPSRDKTHIEINQSQRGEYTRIGQGRSTKGSIRYYND